MTIIFRELQKDDYTKGYIELLSNLSNTGNISYDKYISTLEHLQNSGNYHIFVIEDIEEHVIIGTITLFIEQKFIRECGKVGHIEDVVVSNKYRGSGYGKNLIEMAMAQAEQKGCYKIILDCSKNNIDFYKKCGLEEKEYQMVKYFV